MLTLLVCSLAMRVGLIVAVLITATACGSASSSNLSGSSAAAASASIPTPTASPAPTATPAPVPTATPVPTPVRYQITGKITNAGGAALSGATISVYAAAQLVCAINVEPPTMVSGFRTSADGAYKVAVPPGTYVLWVTSGRTGEYFDGQANTVAGCQAAKRLTVDKDITLDLVFR